MHCSCVWWSWCRELCSIIGTNLNDIPVLNYCSKQLFVFRVILLLLQVCCMLGGKNEIFKKKKRKKEECKQKKMNLNFTPNTCNIVHWYQFQKRM